MPCSAAGLDQLLAVRSLGKAQKEEPVILLILEHRVSLVSCLVFTQKTFVALVKNTLPRERFTFL